MDLLGSYDEDGTISRDQCLRGLRDILVDPNLSRVLVVGHYCGVAYVRARDAEARAVLHRAFREAHLALDRR